MPATSNKSSFISPRTLLWLAWILLALALLIPAPAGSFAGDVFGISAFYVVGKGIVWSEAAPGSPGSLGFWRSALLALALFSNIIYLFAPYLRRCETISLTWKAILLVALVVDVSVAFVIPEFARLPAFWIWLLSIALIVFALMAFPGTPMLAGPKTNARRAPLDNGDVPPFFWVVLAFTFFWIAVSAGNHAPSLPPPATASANVPLTNFVTDHANVLQGDEAARLGAALDTFEKGTSNQIAVAIYPRVPDSSIEAFTIGTADRSRLGRKGIDNGAILFLFMNERTARLEVGYGLEGLLTDVEAHRILDEVLVPAFARGQYFDGLDASLGAIFAVVQDAYRHDRAPSRMTMWWRQVKVGVPKIIGNAWPTVRRLGLGERIGLTLAGSFIALVLWSALGNWGRLFRDVVRGVANVRAGRPFATGMERFDISEVWDSLKLSVWVLIAIVPAAGFVIVALGGAFGGAGAMVRW